MIYFQIFTTFRYKSLKNSEKVAPDTYRVLRNEKENYLRSFCGYVDNSCHHGVVLVYFRLQTFG